MRNFQQKRINGERESQWESELRISLFIKNIGHEELEGWLVGGGYNRVLLFANYATLLVIGLHSTHAFTVHAHPHE